MQQVKRKATALAVGIALGFGAGSLVSGATTAAYGAPKRCEHGLACPTWTIDKPPANPTRSDLLRNGIPVPRWVNLGRCEQPGNGYGGVDWTNDGDGNGGGFVGGLGFAASTYRAYKPASYPWPPKATPWQIIIVAERVKADVGITAWGCSGAF